MAELRPYHPTMRDRIAQFLMGNGRVSPERARAVEGLVGSRGLGTTGLSIADFVPGGQVLAAEEAYRDTGDPRMGLVAMLPMPGASVAGRAAMKGGTSAEKALVKKLIMREIPGKPSVVKIPGTGEMPAMPIKSLAKSADAYMQSVGRPGQHALSSYPAFDETMAKRIAQAFDEMKHNPGDPAVKRAYDAMIEETLAQYRGLKNAGIDIQFMKPGQADPYAASPAMGYEDLVRNGHLWTFPTDSGHGTLSSIQDNPLLKRVGKIGDLENATANDAFRVVHDIYGHFGPGNPFFRHKGEERAWLNHSRMYSDEALPAMTSETRGQNSWLNFGPFGEQNRTASGADTVFADQKVGLLPEWAYADARTPQAPASNPRIPEILTGQRKTQGEVFPQLATRYPETGTPVTKINEKGLPYLAKGQSDEAKRVAIARKLAQADIDAGNYTPYFDASQRQPVDPSAYPTSVNTLTDTLAKRPDTIAKITSNYDTPEARARLNQAFDVGAAMPGTEHWYWMKQLQDEYVKELGPEEGIARFKSDFAVPMAATTGGQDPADNFVMAHYANYLREHGLPMPQGAYEMPYPVGGRFAMSNINMYDKIMNRQGGEIDALNPKRHDFAYNFMGHRNKGTIDEVMSNVMAPGTVEPPKGGYGVAENMVAEEAAKRGLPASEFQDVGWAGGKNIATGGKYAEGRPMIDEINQSIERTSRITGLSPEEVVKFNLIRKQGPMFALFGALGLGGLAGSQDGSGQ